MRRLAAILALALCICWPQCLAADHHIVEVNRMVEPSRQAAPVRIVTMTVTAYTSSVEDCGNTRGITATGSRAGLGTISADWRLYPPGTRLWIPGYGWGVVRDKGGAVRGNRLDVWLNSETECRMWALKKLNVRIIERSGD